MALLFELEAKQHPIEFILPREGPFHAQPHEGMGVVVWNFVILPIRDQLPEKHEQASPNSPIIALVTTNQVNREIRNHLLAGHATRRRRKRSFDQPGW